MPKAWVCKGCSKELTADYKFPNKVDTVTHRGGGKCPGIDQVGLYADVASDKYVKDQKRVANSAKQRQHYSNKSAKAMESYQTPHKNQAVQQQRVDQARALNLPGHASQNSNSGMNNGTASKLRQINGT